MSQLLKRMLFLSAFLCLWSVFADGTSTAGKPAKQPDDGLTNPAIVYRDVDDGGLFLMSSDGAVRQRLTRPRRAASDRLPAWSPDGEWICFFRGAGGNETGGDLYVIRPDGSEQTFVRSFVPEESPVPGWHSDDTVWTPDGTRLVYACDQSPGRGVWVLDLDHPDDWPIKLVFPSRVGRHHFASPQFSPDLDPASGYQGQLAFAGYDDTSDGLPVGDIYTLGITIEDGALRTVGDPTALTADLPPGNHGHPEWSPDGACLAFIEDFSSVGGDIGIAVMAADGTVCSVTNTVTAFSRISWPDDDHIVFDDISSSTGTWDIFGIVLGSRDPFNLTATDRVNEWGPAWNPACDPNNP